MSQKTAKEGPRLSKNQKFSEHFVIRCCPPFTFLNSKREIVDRKYSICRSGCFYQKKEEDWICCACQKTSTSRRATSPQKPKKQPAAPPAVVKAPAKPRSPPRSEPSPVAPNQALYRRSLEDQFISMCIFKPIHQDYVHSTAPSSERSREMMHAPGPAAQMVFMRGPSHGDSAVPFRNNPELGCLHPQPTFSGPTSRIPLLLQPLLYSLVTLQQIIKSKPRNDNRLLEETMEHSVCVQDWIEKENQASPKEEVTQKEFQVNGRPQLLDSLLLDPHVFGQVIRL
ncbi:hypothetical protein HPG69_012932 [Diceros bicornis minor]|uniref:FYVE-type zinc finger domain-containing protein n=1 Tax=Diceros bicornis minor TaxID=77932 RepID=A0A7J7F1B4_DICBM|nr:hypothetical protein HPG69_012932 [Diceros bicornis minor]